MGKQRYRITHPWLDAVVVLDVEHSILTPELATDINDFWSDADDRLGAADDDVVLAVIKLAASCFMRQVMDPNGYRALQFMQIEFDRQEGWPLLHGITLVDFEGEPDINDTTLEVEVVALEAAA